MFTRLLVPLDGSPESAAALPLARTFARATGGSITLLRVVADEDGASDAAATLRRIADELNGSEIQVRGVVRVGDAADKILQQVEAEGADLVIMRTHGRSGLGRAVLGSVAERVLSRSRVPLVLLRPGGRRVSHLRTLLVPVDGSPGGALALGGAVGLAQTTSATLRLLEVVVPIPAYVYAFPLNGSAYIDPAWDDEAQTAATTYVDGIVARLRGAGLAADGEVRVRPSVAEAIVATAEERDADLIVMSTQALVGPARALLGSVTDAVVRTAHCPVLVLHREPARPRPPVESEPRPDMVVTGS